MINEPLANLIRSYSKTNIIIRYVGLALIIRLLIIGYFVFQANQLFPERMIGGLFMKMNDYDYFLGTVDNYIEKGTMTYFDQVKPFAGRMPGYGFPYLLIRLVTGQVTGLVILMSLQILLSALATYALGMIALILFKDLRIFQCVFWSFSIAAPAIIFDIFTLSESFSISAIILFHYFLARFCVDEKYKHLFWAGFFLAWAIFLRPFLGTFILVAPLFIFIRQIKREPLFGVGKKMALFLLPFIVFESAWVARNFLVMGRFIPLETSLSESYGEDGLYRTSAIGIRSMIHAWGGETGEFYDGSEAEWFHFAKGTEIDQYTFKPYVFNAGFTRDSLVALKYIFNQSVNTDLDRLTRDSLNMLANRIALSYAADYKSKNTFRYYVINPFKMYGRLVFSNGTRLLILPAVSKMNLPEKGIKFFYLLFYYGFVLGGMAGMIIYLFKNRSFNDNSLLILFYPWIIATTLVFYASFVIIEYRYLISGFPVFMLFACYGFFQLSFNKKKPAHVLSV